MEPLLPPDALGAIGTHADQELRRILSARAHVATIARIAAGLDVPVVVLKGAADIAAGMDVPSADVDVWAPAPHHETLARALDRAGFADSADPTRFHLAKRHAQGAIPVEVHERVPGFDHLPVGDAVPLQGHPPLLRLAPHDHAWSLLRQAVAHHPERRGRIRDLLLIRSALADCTAAQRVQLEERVRRDPAASLYEQVIAVAESRLPPGARGLYLFLARSDAAPAGLRRTLLNRAAAMAAQGRTAELRRLAALLRHRGMAGIPRFAASAILAVLAVSVARLRTLDEWLL